VSGVAAFGPDAEVASAVGDHTPAHASIDWITAALAVVFLASGASGLIYQIAWVRLLALTFGVTIYAASAVVAVFMGGLALGSFLGGRVADRVGRPIVWYGAAEGMIAGGGLLSVSALAWVQTAYVAVLPRDAPEVEAGVVALRLALAAAVLLVPTTLMGATLPLIVKGSVRVNESIGSRVSWLYAANTAGAILGTLVSGFVLIGVLGIAATIAVAASLNLAAAVAALVLGAAIRQPRNRTRMKDRGAETAAAGMQGDAASGLVRRLVILSFSVQGFASLAYEVELMSEVVEI
jgi:spermidine synthase